jgi:hypothetical protein
MVAAVNYKNLKEPDNQTIPGQNPGMNPRVSPIPCFRT